MRDFQDRMAAGKAKALSARDEGGSTVRIYATTAAKLHALGRIEANNFDRWLIEVQHRVSEIIEQSRYDIYAGRDGWADLIPF